MANITSENLNRINALMAEITDLLRSSAARPPTPAERLGYKVGDVFRVHYKENPVGRAFSQGAIVELYHDDATDCPKFRLLRGTCSFDSAGGKPGAFEYLDHMVKL